MSENVEAAALPNGGAPPGNDAPPGPPPEVRSQDARISPRRALSRARGGSASFLHAALRSALGAQLRHCATT
jgi:hypothetical protein